MKIFYRVMIALLKYERAITPSYAGHYGQLRLDIFKWESLLQKAIVRDGGKQKMWFRKQP